MGMFPEGDNVNVYRILPQTCEDFVASHNKTYYSAERVTMIRTSSEYENGRPERIALMMLHMTFSFLIFFAILPLQLVYRLCEFIYRQISRLCYSGLSESMETSHAELFGSSGERP